jgi:hypothetical protein
MFASKFCKLRKKLYTEECLVAFFSDWCLGLLWFVGMRLTRRRVLSSTRPVVPCRLPCSESRQRLELRPILLQHSGYQLHTTVSHVEMHMNTPRCMKFSLTSHSYGLV